MTEWKEKGLILKYGHFHESDMWLKMLLENHGLFTVFAFGGARSKRRFCGCLDILNILNCRIHINRTGEYHILEEATLLSTPHNLRKEWRRMGIIANCLKFIDALSIGPDTAKDCFIFMQNFRDTCEIQQPILAQYFFRLKIAHILGFIPNIDSCACCGTQNIKESIFLAPMGQVFCPQCFNELPKKEKHNYTFLSHNTVSILKNVISTLPSVWPIAGLKPIEQRQCGQLIDLFIQFHLGLEWQNGIFKKV